MEIRNPNSLHHLAFLSLSTVLIWGGGQVGCVGRVSVAALRGRYPGSREPRSSTKSHSTTDLTQRLIGIDTRKRVAVSA